VTEPSAVSPDRSLPVCVRFFALYREWAGEAERHVMLSSGATVADLLETLRASPGLERLPLDTKVAVNLDYVGAEHVLTPDDEVALIPPVAGG
jgi:molybdopterin converting factor subunit 1